MKSTWRRSTTMPAALTLPTHSPRTPRATSAWPGEPPPFVDGAHPVFEAARCDLNGACAAACPVAAITVGASFALDRGRCISCARCIEACPTHALAPALVFGPPAVSRELLREPRGSEDAAGRLAGRALGQWARAHLNGRVDAVVLLGLSAAGTLPAARMTGAAVGIKEILPGLNETSLIHLDGKGGYVESIEAVQKYLQRTKAERIIAAAMNDASALGALRALEECGRAEKCAVAGQNATAAGRHEIRTPGTRMIASVAFFPETYGEHLIALALDILANKPVPPAVFVKHILITPGNVDHFYPNDALLKVPDADVLLWKSFH